MANSYTLRRSEQAREPYAQKRPLRGRVTAVKKSKLLEIHDDLKLVMSFNLTEGVRKRLQLILLNLIFLDACKFRASGKGLRG